MACIHPLQAAATSVRDPCARCSTMFLRLHQLLQCPRRPTPTEGGAAPSVAGAGAGAVQPDPGPASAPTPRGHRPPPLPPSRTLRQEILAAAGLPAEARIVWHFSWDFSGQPLVAAVVPICYLRPGHDVVCLPRHRAVEHFWAWAAPLYGYLPWQAVWYTPGPELRVHRQVLDAVQALASPARVELPPRQPRRGPLRTAPDRPRGCWPHPKEDGRAAPEHTAAVGGQPPAVGVTDATRGVGGWRPNRRAGPRAALLIVPLQRTEALTRAAGARGLPVFGDCTWGAARVPDKGRLHSPPGDGPRSVPDGYLRHPVTHQLTDVRVPKGFRCRTKRELREAYAALTQAGLAVVLKPSWGNGSHGIEREVSQQRILEYTWDYSEGSVVLEEMLKIDRSGVVRVGPMAPFGGDLGSALGRVTMRRWARVGRREGGAWQRLTGNSGALGSARPACVTGCVCAPPPPLPCLCPVHRRIVTLCCVLGGGGVGTRPWWLALLACGGAYWPLTLEPSAMTSRHPYFFGGGGAMFSASGAVISGVSYLWPGM